MLGDANADELPTKAFGYRNYRRFFFGQSISNIGTWFQMLAQGLLVLKLTGRASALGETVALQTLPLLVVGPFVGPLLDRMNLRRVLIGVAAVAGCEAAALATLTATHHVTIYWIFGLSFVLGFAQIANQPSVQAIVSELVAPNAIPSAVSLNSVQMASGRLAGPALAALLYSWKGPAVCYAVNASSSVVVIVALLSLHTAELYPRRSRQRGPHEIREGLAWAWNSRAHRGQLLSNAFVGLFAWNFGIFYTSMTQQVLHSGSLSLGIAESINAAAAVSFGIVLSRRLHRPTRRTYVGGCIGLGFALIGVALSPDVGVFYGWMVVFGVTTVSYASINQTVLQTITPSDRLASVMTLSTLGTQGTTPIGALVVGWLITIGTARTAIAVGGSSLLLAALALAPGVRRTVATARAATEEIGGAEAAATG